VLATLLNPVTPKACQKLWDAIGESLGELNSQSVTNAASWGQLSPGVKLGELEALFPRVEEQ
jgi:methionyl-tRNA synthetase